MSAPMSPIAAEPRTVRAFLKFLGGALSDPKERRLLALLAAAGLLTIGVAAFLVSPAILISMVVVMVLSYLNNACYSVTSRSGTRSSGTYHAFAMLVNNLIWFSVLRQLILTKLSIAYFIPYTVATVAGSVTGSKFSQRVEEYFGITTDPKAKESPSARKAKRTLLLVLGLLVLGVMPFVGIAKALTIAAMMFANDVAFSWLRRARNSSHAWYHIAASVVQSGTFFFLYHTLTKDMSFALFIPYAFGSVTGSVFGQETAMKLERVIGASMDAHVKNTAVNIMPWQPFALLSGAVIALTLLSGNIEYALVLVGISAAQQVAFSLVSRSRTRNNLTYHAIASIFSNGVWFLVFRQLQQGDWTADMYLPYAAGAALGSISGATASMAIERKLKIVSN